MISVLLTIKVFARREEFVCDAAKGFGFAVTFWLRLRRAVLSVSEIFDRFGDPRAVLSGLNRVLFAQLRGQFISVAYLWLDVENRKALYSAAGHPPLLRWRQDKLERIESNGFS